MASVDVVKQVGEELEKLKASCGLGKVDEFLKKLDEIKAAVANGPAELLNKVIDAAKSLQNSISEALKNPSAIAGGGGPLVACASWYGEAIVGRLKALLQEVTEVVDFIMKKIGEVTKPLKSVGDVLADVMKGLDGSAKHMCALPDEVMKLGTTVKTPKDLAAVDSAAMKKALDVSHLDESLNKLGTLKTDLGAAAVEVTTLVGKVADFLADISVKVTSAFDVPAPLCFMTPLVMSQAPPLMAELLEKVKLMNTVDLKPVSHTLEGLNTNLAAVDVNVVKKPLQEFSKQAASHVDKLDKAVSAAKLAHGGALGSLFGK